MTINELPLNEGVIFERTYDILMDNMTSAANRLMKGDKKAAVDTSLIVAIVTNGAFACELYLKSLLPQGTRGHVLSSFFNRLDSNTQARIKQETVKAMLKQPGIKEYDEAQFDENLRSMENSFVEWRYFYSENTQRVTPQFYKAFMTGIRIVAVAEKNGENA